MSSTNLSLRSTSTNEERHYTPQQPASHNTLQQLPAELLIRIFLLAQNPQLRLATRGLYGISRSALIRAQFLIYRFGRTGVLGERGMTSFRMASSLAVVDNLLKLRCNPRADSDWLVWRAVEQQDVRLFILLVDAIQPDTRTLERYLNGAAMQGSISIVDVLVGRYGGSIHHGNDTMMMLACVGHQVAMVLHLIGRYGCDPHAERDQYLRRACLDGDDDLVAVLLPGANIHCFNDAPLQNAAHKQHSHIIRRLLEAGADPHANRGASLISAVRNNDLASVSLLLDAGADARCQEDSPLQWLCRQGGGTAILEALVVAGTRNGTPAATMVNCGKGMPLYEALTGGHAMVVEGLLGYGADPTTQRALEGLHEAILRNHVICVELVVKATPSLVLLNPPSYYLSKSKLTGPMRLLLQNRHGLV